MLKVLERLHVARRSQKLSVHIFFDRNKPSCPILQLKHNAKTLNRSIKVRFFIK